MAAAHGAFPEIITHEVDGVLFRPAHAAVDQPHARAERLAQALFIRADRVGDVGRGAGRGGASGNDGAEALTVDLVVALIQGHTRRVSQALLLGGLHKTHDPILYNGPVKLVSKCIDGGLSTT